MAFTVWSATAAYSMVAPSKYVFEPVVMTVAPKPAAFVVVVERFPPLTIETNPAPPIVNVAQLNRPRKVRDWLEASVAFSLSA